MDVMDGDGALPPEVKPDRKEGAPPVQDRRRGRRETDLALLTGCADGLAADAVSPEAIVGDVVEVLRLMGCPAGMIVWGQERDPRVLAAFGLPVNPRTPPPEGLMERARAAAAGEPVEGPTPPPFGPLGVRLGAAVHLVPLVRAGTCRGAMLALRRAEVEGAERHEAAVFRLLGHLLASALDAAERADREVRTHFAVGHDATVRVLGRELARARALEVPCSFVRVRLLGVGKVNSRAGLPVGDAIFEAVRSAIEAEVPEVGGLDLVGRHLADSWAIVLPGYSRGEAEALGRAIEAAARVRLADVLADHPVEVRTAVAAVPDDGRHVASIIRRVSDDVAFPE